MVLGHFYFIITQELFSRDLSGRPSPSSTDSADGWSTGVPTEQESLGDQQQAPGRPAWVSPTDRCHYSKVLTCPSSAGPEAWLHRPLIFPQSPLLTSLQARAFAVFLHDYPHCHWLSRVLAVLYQGAHTRLWSSNLPRQHLTGRQLGQGL
jgi:hypothetical protein